MPTFNIKDIPESKMVKLVDLSEDSINKIAEAVVQKIAEPVRHGHWELSPFDRNWTFSNCGDKPYHSNMKNMNYCPKCGAKMDKVKK